ncbi:glutamate-1-semialdehyde 2,1-aminomutase [Ignicoccus hospitalis]|uniref:Glutamate-1-semialdehyde 2,1-aminomutase n=1 Tax=Ignicoccus hospitalis (strain KIN4/I / DSM 18386 / JCM 14125) TaxID=453591 RepID=GSA_IGNH4|nr:glutamate-1-semialdehyde 2,1-aminomutase [Ignicoccus hospitalis]A8AAB3.1 RecName: Full=Glutamate-1-semialdehyde 2,1-aminomutase; Short=GSA; AltName: Full=Glutamate-1-semialdehyde aminotransferase; Short=GSA-AT [Ignicoccus hospitalis KIN4/I]ABU81865.1 glutamate-1-semialdehyde 2,1-aminomutase [Ignicoccus hospitalis KIN4/I]HIH90133.1 glutamate-1-semialdehyde 2,1-aminomutase [Desulfurococcaceae archaeon]
MDRSLELFQIAKNLFPGGVNSPIRAAVKPYPFYVKKASGATLVTVDGVELIDYVLGYGPLILGHMHPKVLEAVEEQLNRGWLYGTPHELEIELAKKIVSHYPSIDMVRFVNSGTEATMTAIRLARGFTKKNKIIKFDGCYHGAHDSVLVKAGSAVSHFGVPGSAGVPEEVSKLTLVVPFNDVEAVEKVAKENQDDLAAIIVEPVMGNAGVIPPKEGFLKELRRIADETGALLIFDEVITGYRLGLGGAQAKFGVVPDLTTLGKIVGGGFPVGVVGGKREIMEYLTPSGPVFNAGTFNAHPVTMAAGLATINELERGYVYEVANSAAEKVAKALEQEAVAKFGGVVHRVASMFQWFPGVEEVNNYADALKANKEISLRLHEELLKRGVFIAPSLFEAWFTSAAHGEDVVNKTLEALSEALKVIS